MSIPEIIENNVLKCFGHVKRMGKESLVKRVYRANIERNKERRRPQRRWRDEVKDLLEREEIVLARDRDAWGGILYRSE